MLKEANLKRIGLFSSLLIVCLLFCSASGTDAQEDVSVCTLAGHLAEYDGQTVSIRGSITSYSETDDSYWGKATSFNVMDGNCKVWVLADGYLGFGKGARVRVVGRVNANVTKGIAAISVQRIQ